MIGEYVMNCTRRICFFYNGLQICSDTHCFWCETNLFSDKAKINLNKDEEDEEDQENEIEEDQEPNDTFPTADEG